MEKFLISILVLSIIGCSSLVFADLSAEALAKADTQQWTSLNGTWQTINGINLTEMPSEGWSDFQVPGAHYSPDVGEPSFMWAKRQIDIPKSWQNRRIFVRFNSCRFNPHVYIDGKLIAERMDGWTPFEVEITLSVNPGSTHWLQLRCQDQTATFADGFLLEPNKPREAIRGKVLAPLGGHPMFYGPADDVWLFSRPEIYLDDIAIIPSTRNNTLTVSGIISDKTTDDLWVEGKAFDKDELSLEIPASPVKDNKWEISAPFPNAEYWSPENPHLYKLQLILHKGKDGQILDTIEERFGFKEFWIEGPDFYLNGVKRHLLASSTWPISEVESYEKVREKLEAVKAGNNVAFRYHTQPWPKRWVEIADEVGIMIIDEAAVYTDSVGMYAYNDERFWENYREHLEGLVKRDRNNASVIMWSIENELLFMGMTRYSQDLPKKLGDLGRFVKALDPQHPITFEGDLDPDEAADVLGLHYPHELPTYADWPNTADWLSKRIQTEAGGGMLGMTRRNFYWDRTKPLYIGEYLWTPAEDYAAGTIFFGDKAYTNKDKYHNKAKLQAWIDQTIAYRRFGVSGICPWSCFAHGVIIDDLIRPFYEAQKEFYQPVTAFLRNKDARFFCGDTVERTFDTFNDGPSGVNLTLKWRLSDTNIKGEEKFKIEAGEYRAVNINFVAPDVNQPTEFELQSELFKDSEQVQTTKYKYTVTKRQPLKYPADTKVLLYDPQNTFHKNIPWAERINSLAKLNGIDINNSLLIIAPQIAGSDVTDTQIGQTLFEPTSFLNFLKKGGKAIILEQNTLNGFGLGLILTEKASTMTFGLDMEHPILAGLTENDLKFWRNDNYVTNYEIIRPTSYGARAVTVSGSNKNLNQAPILELATDKGSALFIQALVGKKLNVEPAARKILQNSIDYMASKKPNMSNVAVFANDSNFTTALSRTGLKYRKIEGELNSEKLKNADILILNGGGEKIIQAKDTITAFLDASPLKTVYWHCPEEKTFDALKTLIGADSLSLIPYQGPVSIDLRESQLLSGISREDLLFVESQARSWERTLDIDPSIIDRTVMPGLSYSGQAKKNNSEGQKIQAKYFELKGNSVSFDPENNTVKFKAKGTASGWITMPQSGMYILSLMTGGKEIGGIYPFIIIKVNDEIVAQINLTQNETREYPFLAELPTGRNKLELSFVNGSDWGGGRELTLDSLLIGEKINLPENIEFLTLPAALVSISANKGKVIIDNVKWDTNKGNEIRGHRYASALLANLGMSFQVEKNRDITWLGIENFELIGASPYFDKSDNRLNFRSNGTAATDFTCAKKAEYTVYIKGYSTPANSRYAFVNVFIDNKLVGRKTIASDSSRDFKIATVTIPKGQHKVRISFVNDLTANGQDRNLSVEGVGFKEK